MPGRRVIREICLEASRVVKEPPEVESDGAGSIDAPTWAASRKSKAMRAAVVKNRVIKISPAEKQE
jgi:hypothetical protein